MVDWISQFPPVVQALMGTMFTWFVTALGALYGVLLQENV